MKYNFSSQFLKPAEGDNNFGEAWESFCFQLLSAERNSSDLVRLAPPDLGVDIIDRARAEAYQCKASHQGLDGSISGSVCVQSLRRAKSYQSQVQWNTYAFATNANITGDGYAKLNQTAEDLGLLPGYLVYLSPRYWSELCEKHYEEVRHRLDYRLTVSEEQVIEAFEKASGFDQYNIQFRRFLERSRLSLVVGNNRTPLVLQIPFSWELTVQDCLATLRELLGLSRDWMNFSDLGTAGVVSLGLELNQKDLYPVMRLMKLNLTEETRLQMRIEIEWSDRLEDGGREARDVPEPLSLTPDRPVLSRGSLTRAQRQRETAVRTEMMVQKCMWCAAGRILDPSRLTHTGH